MCQFNTCVVLANTEIDASLPKIEIFGSFFLVTTAPTGSDLAHPYFHWVLVYEVPNSLLIASLSARKSGDEGYKLI